MNQLSTEARSRIIRCLVEGNSIRATARLTGNCKKAITRLLCEIGDASLAYQDATLRSLPCQRIQCDEIWSFVGCKEQHLQPDEQKKGRGDVWTWTAIDPDTKLMVCWHVGLREYPDAAMFMEDLASRMANRIQLTTDGYRSYRPAVMEAFGHEVDYAIAVKVYGLPLDSGRIEARYSPSKCKEVTKIAVIGDPDPDHISTSHNERHNLTMRMQMRRFTRLTNGFSKKFQNHVAAVNLYMMHYNFSRVHQTLRCTPAMEAGVADHVWDVEEIVSLLDTRPNGGKKHEHHPAKSRCQWGA
ncbi:MAG: IS1 family transposase [Lacunisphaera sp.]